jgi:hypothetical protein
MNTRLTALKLGNFKAFAETQNIPIRPLTLIFGANSSGKSIILHGLLYGSHAINGEKRDAHKIRTNHGKLDLGGFQQFVHRGDLQNSLKLGFVFEKPRHQEDAVDPFFSVKRIGVEIEITKSPVRHSVNVGSLDYSVDDVCLFKMFSTGCSHRISEFSFNHPLFKERVLKWVERMTRSKLTSSNVRAITRAIDEWRCEYRAYVDGLVPNQMSLWDDAMVAGIRIWPNFAPLRNWLKKKEKYRETPWAELTRIRVKINRQRKNKELAEIAKFLTLQLVEAVLLRVHQHVLANIGSVQHIGPVRDCPQRDFVITDRPSQESCWLDVAKNPSLQKKINQWLGNERMDTPYRLICPAFDRRKQVTGIINRKINGDLSSVMWQMFLIDGRNNTLVSFADVGVGISQVMPVLASAFGTTSCLQAIEQPELHFHPKLQAELGDLFIESALGEQKNTFLLETHSEHLILRILRRIRETSNGDNKGIPVRPEDVSVLYVQPTNSGSKVIELPVTADGDFSAPWPGGFFAERFQDLPL